MYTSAETNWNFIGPMPDNQTYTTNPEAWVILATLKETNKPIAYMTLNPSNQGWSIGTVSVSDKFHRQGISRAMHDMAYEWAKGQGKTLFSGDVIGLKNQNYWEQLESQGKAQKIDDRRWERLASNWLYKSQQIAADQLYEEFRKRYYRLFNLRRESKANINANTYFELAQKEHEIDQKIRQEWGRLADWLQEAVKQYESQLDPQSLESFIKEIEKARAIANEAITPPQPEDFEGYVDDEVIQFYLERKNLKAIQVLLDQADIYYDTTQAPSGKQVMIIDTGDTWVIELDDFSYWDDANDWIRDAAMRAYEFYPEKDDSEEFWSNVTIGSILYHMTKNDRIEDIKKKGLEARSETRGLYNKGMPPAVFTIAPGYVDDPASALSSYGDILIEIDVGAMKADGYMPTVSKETPVEEAEMEEALAYMIGIEDYDAEVEDDYMPDTIAIYDDVPPKYLRILE